MADVISKILYPEDNHYEGKSLRLKQQYFFVSATVQSITRQHIQVYGTLKNFHEKNVIQINDTHPALVVPELMRILIDDAGLSWEEAWHITVNSVAYTNHTVLAEALECWPQKLMEELLPRVWQIIQEISKRWQSRVESYYHGDMEKVAKMAPEMIAEKRKVFKGVSPNVDFYSGLIYRMLGLPCELFTPIFAVARIAGWSAHRIEEIQNAGKIIRPAYISVKEDRDYIPMGERLVE
jgi:hypothetical protein